MPDFVTEDFHFGAGVYSSDGKHVGMVHRLVCDEGVTEPRLLIVKEGKLFSGRLLAPGSAFITDDLIVPLGAIKNVERQRVELTLSAAEVRHLPPYLSYRFLPRSRRDVIQETVTVLAGSVYMPPMQESADKAPDEIEIERGENVMLGKTGRKLGSVRDVLLQSGELIGIVMHPGLFKEDVVLPVRFLERSDDMSLFAHLDESDLANLQPFHPTDEA